MSEEQALEQVLFGAFVDYGLKDSTAAKLAKRSAEVARREKHKPPFTRPGILIDDRYAAGRGIIITIRRDKAPDADQHEILKDYVERNKYPGDWSLKEATSQNPRLSVYQASMTRSSSKAQVKAAEADLLKDFNKLPPKKQQEILAALQK